MLDTNMRKYVAPVILGGAKTLRSWGLTPIHVTTISFFIGLLSSFLVLKGLPVAAVCVLWISGYLDAVDGDMARRYGMSSKLGALMDITFDRLVEWGIVLAVGWCMPDTRFALLILGAAIVFSMTVFLTTGALVNKQSNKAFYYQAGLMERTEGFIGFSALILFSSQAKWIALVMAAFIFFTGIQRFFWSATQFGNERSLLK